MTRLLHIVASPRDEASQSNTLAKAYLEKRRKVDPGVTVDTIHLWQANLPEFDGDKAAAKMTFFGVGSMDDTRQSAWDEIVAITDRFRRADEYVFAVPMWNGGVPYKLKHYIDLITQPGLLFGFDPERGYFGLLENKRAMVFYTAGVFAPGVESKYGEDFHSTYLNWWLRTIGVNEIDAVRLQPSLLTPDPVGDQAAAVQRAENLASMRFQ